MKLLVCLLVSIGAVAARTGPTLFGPDSGYLSRTTVVLGESWLTVPGTSVKLAKLPLLRPGEVTAFRSASGGQVLLLRYRTEGAPGVRLHLQNLSLPPGARLFVYHPAAVGPDSAEVFGPIEGTGPGRDGEVWAGPMSGAEAVIEIQAGDTPLATLPFSEAEMELLDGQQLSQARQARQPQSASMEREVRASLFRGVPLTHEVRDGLAIFEGDIVLGQADELPPASENQWLPGRETLGRHRESTTVTMPSNIWPNGVIPYVIDPSLPNPDRVTGAVAHWNAALGGVVQLVPRAGQANFVTFIPSPSSGQCASTIGMFGWGVQYTYLGDGCGLGNVIHEIGHVAGLWHEQSRMDRDQHIKIRWENIQPAYVDNFTQNVVNAADRGAYDFDSIMHYPAVAYSANGQPTIETIPPGIPIGQRLGLSAGDIAGVRAMYGLTTPPPAPPPVVSVTVTINANPATQPFVVDGVTYVGAQSFQWVEGTSHTLSVGGPVTSNGTRTQFAYWSNGGAQSQTINVQANTTSYTANFSTFYRVAAAGGPGGSVSLSPAVADGYYPALSSVTATATPLPGYCFQGWTGLLAGTGASAQIMVNQPYDIQANFSLCGGPGTGSESLAFVSTMLFLPGSGGTYRADIHNPGTLPQFTAQSSAGWLRVLNSPLNSGSTAVQFALDPNDSGMLRFGFLTMGASTLIVVQYSTK